MLKFFPHNLGQKKGGVEKTYKFFKQFINNEYSVVKCKNNGISNFYKNIKNLYDVNMLHSKNINIGGDHSMSIATVASTMNQYKNAKVIWLDAHPDINTYESSLSKNYHGMPLSYLTGIDCNKSFKFIKNFLDMDNLLYVGIRDIDDFEKNIIDKYKIKYITCDEINYNYDNTIKKIKDFVGESPIHISFDVDSMDPSIIPCTGTRSKNGLNYNAKLVLDNLLETSNVVNIDITEINLDLGNRNDKIKTLLNLSFIFNNILHYNEELLDNVISKL